MQDLRVKHDPLLDLLVKSYPETTTAGRKRKKQRDENDVRMQKETHTACMQKENISKKKKRRRDDTKHASAENWERLKRMQNENIETHVISFSFFVMKILTQVEETWHKNIAQKLKDRWNATKWEAMTETMYGVCDESEVWLKNRRRGNGGWGRWAKFISCLPIEGVWWKYG